MLWLQLLLSLLLLFAGAEALIRGAVRVAAALGVSPLMVGLVLVGFGTSTPELVTSVRAALAGSPAIAVGNVLGSNIANVLLILGLSAAIFPMSTHPEAFRRDGGMLAAVTVIGIALALYGGIGRFAGAAMLVLLAGYVTYTYRTESLRPDASGAMHAAEADLGPPQPPGWRTGAALTLLGLALTIFGAQVLVDAAIALSRMGLSESFIGLTMVAIGTSLPELATSAVAAWRRQADVAFGNIVGSNIFNILGILGVTALVRPLSVPPGMAAVDIWVMAAATALLLLFAMTGWRLTRGEGAVFLLGYAAYLGWLALAG